MASSQITPQTDVGRRSGLTGQLVRLSVPMIMSNLAYTLLGVMDTLFMGRVSTTSLGAVGLGSMMFWTMAVLLRGTIAGTTPFVARHYGAGDFERAGKYLQYFLFLAICLSPVVLLLPWAFGLYFRLLRPDPAVAAEALIYVNIRLLELPFSLMVTAFIGFLIGIGNTKLPMALSWITVGVNVVVNYVLIFGKLGFPPMGIAGAAWGTVVAVAVQIVVASIWVFRNYSVKYRLKQFSLPAPSRFRSMVKIGSPIGVTDAVELGAWTTFFALISRLGAVELAASQIANQVVAVAFMPAFGLAAATGSLVGRSLGAKQPKTAEAVGYRGALLGAAAMGMLGVGFWVFSGQLGRLFTTDTQVLELTRTLLRIMAFFQVFDGFNIVFRGALNGAGDTRFTMLTMGMLSWILFVPLVYVLAFSLGLELMGAWLAAMAYILGVGIIFTIRFRGGGWQAIQLEE